MSADLYKVYIAELLEKLDQSGRGITIGTTHLAGIASADDLLCLAENQNNMQYLVKIVEDYAKSHRYQLHQTKSVIAVYNGSPPDIELYNKPMQVSNIITHLGIDRDL